MSSCFFLLLQLGHTWASAVSHFLILHKVTRELVCVPKLFPIVLGYKSKRHFSVDIVVCLVAYQTMSKKKKDKIKFTFRFTLVIIFAFSFFSLFPSLCLFHCLSLSSCWHWPWNPRISPWFPKLKGYPGIAALCPVCLCCVCHDFICMTLLAE